MNHLLKVRPAGSRLRPRNLAPSGPVALLSSSCDCSRLRSALRLPRAAGALRAGRSRRRPGVVRTGVSPSRHGRPAGGGRGRRRPAARRTCRVGRVRRRPGPPGTGRHARQPGSAREHPPDGVLARRVGGRPALGRRPGRLDGPGQPVRRDHPGRRNDRCASPGARPHRTAALVAAARLVDRGGRLRARRDRRAHRQRGRDAAARDGGRAGRLCTVLCRGRGSRGCGRLELACGDVHRRPRDLGAPGLVAVPRPRAPRLRRGARGALRGITRPRRRRPAAPGVGLLRRTAVDAAMGPARGRPADRLGTGQPRVRALRHPRLRSRSRSARSPCSGRSPWAPAGRPDAGSTASGPSPACCPRCCRSRSATSWRTTSSTS